MPRAGFSGVTEQNPNNRTVQFAGKYINLSAIAREHGMDLSNLSLILSGKRNPTMRTVVKLTRILNLTIDQFQSAIEERRDYLDRPLDPFAPLEPPAVA